MATKNEIETGDDGKLGPSGPEGPAGIVGRRLQRIFPYLNIVLKIRLDISVDSIYSHVSADGCRYLIPLCFTGLAGANGAAGISGAQGVAGTPGRQGIAGIY